MPKIEICRRCGATVELKRKVVSDRELKILEPGGLHNIGVEVIRWVDFGRGLSPLKEPWNVIGGIPGQEVLCEAKGCVKKRFESG